MPTPAQARALVERIAASSTFQRSPRLRELLQYISECALRHPPTSLTEQQIGIAIFHRPPQYDSSSDTIVRVQMSQLRKRLEHYYLTEGQGEPAVIEIPRGSYNAVFHLASQMPPAQHETAEATAEAAPAAPTRPAGIRLPGRRIIAGLAVLSAVLAVACAWLAVRLERAQDSYASRPAMRSLWSNLIRPAQKTSVVVADSAFGFLQDALGTPLDLDQYLQHDPQQWVQSSHPAPNIGKMLEMLAFRQYTSIADLGMARRILLINPALQSQVSVVFARNYSTRAAASDNVVLLGSQRSNPWVHLYLDRLNFHFDYDEVLHKAIVRNRSPRQGETATFMIEGEGPSIKEGYAIVAFLPNQARTANTLILAGTDMEATEAAGQLVTTEAELEPVLSHIAGRGELPYFEALFKTRRLGGAPQECRLAAWRPIQK
jgi:hypothetical protein